jgi:hypothetical protein
LCEIQTAKKQASVIVAIFFNLLNQSIMFNVTNVDKFCPEPVVKYLFEQLVSEIVKTPQKIVEPEIRDDIENYFINILSCENLNDNTVEEGYKTLIQCYLFAEKDENSSKPGVPMHGRVRFPMWIIIGHLISEIGKKSKNPKLLKTIFNDFNSKETYQNGRYFVFMELSGNSYTPKNILKKLFWLCSTEKRFINIGFNLVENGNLRMSFKKILVTKYKSLQRYIRLNEFHNKYEAIMSNFYVFEEK